MESRAIAGFLAAAEKAVVNADNAEALSLCSGESRSPADGQDASPTGLGLSPEYITFALTAEAPLRATDLVEYPDGADFRIGDTRVTLAVPGRHNVSNALAAIGAATAIGIPLAEAAAALASFTGLKRRMDVVGTANDITVIDDFGHNPDKIAATLSALHAFPGRLLVFFQPHGYGPLKQMGRELAYAFRNNLADGDRLVVSDPAYFGGTVDRSIGSETLVDAIGEQAEHIPDRAACGERLIHFARPGDRIIVMGARDDTLSDFAQGLLDRLATA